MNNKKSQEKSHTHVKLWLGKMSLAYVAASSTPVTQEYTEFCQQQVSAQGSAIPEIKQAQS